MTSNELRIRYLDFFAGKDHEIVPSAPMVIKNDPSLMFTNAGMNQFKDIFLGNSNPKIKRIANSQKCLRVSGKHNDLEEVGHDTYHHTMFEMLGNWSFGDYFKKEAIEWAWEFLTRAVGIPEDRLYATVFEGSPEENISMDEEAYRYWRNFLPEERILKGSKKDNFWEMGDTGPCGPCSEIHCDIRDPEIRKSLPGQHLVNKGDPMLIEIWNLVFIQYNRLSNGTLSPLPQKHVDTGMGFERLCMIVQGKKSNYETDIFQPLINEISSAAGIPYGSSSESDVAMRVASDHLRAVAFSIADGQLPSNVKAGYVIRRILRRAVRFSYTFLKQDCPFLYRFVPVLADIMGGNYPELLKQQKLIEKVIHEEENSFLNTLSTGIRLLDQLTEKARQKNLNIIRGEDAFTLYDTYGFPLDLTQLILKEKGFTVETGGFEKEMTLQRSRSKTDAEKETGDWVILYPGQDEEFTGYDTWESDIRITRYRRVVQKEKEYFNLVFDRTPFYAESGGQVGDKGFITDGSHKIHILDTIKENNVIIHITKELPGETDKLYRAVVSGGLRRNTEKNHSATHLLHFALRQVLGRHVEQKGSLVHPDYLRFDFSHFQKVTDEEIRKIETIVNEMIRENIQVDEKRSVPLAEAREMGAIALFGEKYEDTVRVIKFDDSVELCGGTHVRATGQIGLFKILKESAIAAGIRRIEAVTGEKAEQLVYAQFDTLKKINEMLSSQDDPAAAVEKLRSENLSLARKLESAEKEKLLILKNELLGQTEKIGEIRFLSSMIELKEAGLIRDLAFQIRSETNNLILVLGSETEGGKANLAVMITDDILTSKKINAVSIIKEISKEIGGNGGGQPFFATAGGKNPSGLKKALEAAREIVLKTL